jgi:glucose-1-phosphate thymidylyltransferase
MNIIVPMAGMGKRMRPHTLTVPKPLVPIAGKPIVQRLIEDIAKVAGEKIDNIGFVVGHFGEKVEKDLIEIAASVGAQGHIYYQEEALGTAHAILCAKPLLDGKVIVAFADTLFKADFKLDTNQDGIIWVQAVEDPSQFGVVKIGSQNEITDFVEKPQTPISNLAIIGIYYFKDGAFLNQELQYLIDNNVVVKGEYQITDGLFNMMLKGTKFVPGTVTEWWDWGKKNATVFTNQRYLEYIRDQDLVSKKAQVLNSIIIAPSYIADGVVIENSVVGPHVSIGKNTIVRDSRVQNTIIQENTTLDKVLIANSMVGNNVSYTGNFKDLSIGDFNSVQD